MSSVDSNLIIIGGGPTGSFSALQAAKTGVSTTILEEHDRIGFPSHCTGHISLTGVRHLELNIPRMVYENEIKSAVFYSPSGKRFTVRFPHPVTCVINRELLDQHLFDTALKAGAEASLGTCVHSLLVENGYVKGVRARRDTKTEEFRSKIVIDAEGVSSTILKRAGIPTLNSCLMVRGVQAEVNKIKDIQEDTVEVYLGRKFAPGFFAWIVPRRDGTGKIGLATEKGNPREYFHNFARHHPIVSQKLKRSRIESLVYHPISLGGPIPKTYYNGLLIAGDAASQVKPTTGGGIVMGLTAAKIAGEVATEAIQTQDYSADFLSKYEHRWKRKIGFDMKAMKHIRLMLNSFTDRKLDRLVSICANLGVEKSLKQVRDIDFQGRSLIRMAKNPRALATALYLLAISFF